MNQSSEALFTPSPNTDQLLSVPSCTSSDTPFASDTTSISSLISLNDKQTHSPNSIPLTLIRTRRETSSSSTIPPALGESLPATSSLAVSLLSADRLGDNLIIPEASLSSHLGDNLSPTYSITPRPLAGDTSANLSRQLSECVSLSLSPCTKVLPIDVSHRNTLPCNLSLSMVAPKQFAPIITSSKHKEISDSVPKSVSGLANAWLCTTGYVVPTSLARSTLTSEYFQSHHVDTDWTGLNGPDEPYPRNLRSQSMSSRTLSSFFSWGGNHSPALSPASTTSDKSSSPPCIFGVDSHALNRNNTPSSIFITKQPNVDEDGYFGRKHLPTPLATPTPSPSTQIEEMEKELQEISSELAASIRREMELEDLVEQLQADMRDRTTQERRTSDYFSDSGTTSSKFTRESEPKQYDIERVISKDEQSRAQMRLQLITTVQEERAKRKQLEIHIKSLEDKASYVKVSSTNSINMDERMKELENFCEDLRRCLAKGTETKMNSEGLLMLKAEFQNSLNERDNLRDEIVPQLKARVEGLEAQAAAYEKLAYDQPKIDHNKPKTNDENLILINSQKAQNKVKSHINVSNTNLQKIDPTSWIRSNSIQQATDSRLSFDRETAGVAESSESLVERLRDVELQRDSLHLALKSLLERQEHQNRENQKRINHLELELERAYSSSPRLSAYNKEVQQLRDEISALRIRADEAIHQKWKCERSLSELQIDLERTEIEVGSLRKLLLQEKETFLPSEVTPTSETTKLEPLEHSYMGLQKTYTESLEQIKRLGTSLEGPEIRNALESLEQSLLNAINERDSAARDVKLLRQHNQSILDSAKSLVSDQAALAEQLHDSANKVEDLSIQVRQQLEKNAKLRQRLAMTIARGENEQETNALKIKSLQNQLKSLEKQLLVARKQSEGRLKAHEDDIHDLKDNQTKNLLRLRDGIRSPSPLSYTKPIKSPRSLPIQGSIAEDAKVSYLRQKIVELEKALSDADKQMEEVVNRMNTAQIQVMNLQNEREEAARETKKLKSMIESAKAQASSGSWTAMILS